MENTMERLGLSKNESGRTTFNEGVFSRTVLSKYNLRVSGDDFYIYTEDNFWKRLEVAEVRKLCKLEFDKVDNTLWRLNYENKYIPTLKVDALRIPVDFLNRYPYKINFQNGVYDFLQRELEPHSEKNFFTYRNDYGIYREISETPLFDELLEVASNSRKELKEYILEFMAYIVSGNKTEQKFFILKGSGANCKSTLLNLLIKLLKKEFVTTISLSKLGDRFALSPVVGKKLIVASENEGNKNNKISTEILKMLSSGKELVEIQKKYKDSYSDIVQVELVFAINNNIRFSETSVGLTRRLTVIPFDGVIKNIDPTFEDRLEKEIPGIMRKLVEAYENIAERGFKLKDCKLVVEATKSLLAEGEKESLGEGIYDFFEENIIQSKAEREAKSEVFGIYKKNGGYNNETKFWMDFRKYCEFKKIDYREVRNGARYIEGIKLIRDKSMVDLLDIFEV